MRDVEPDILASTIRKEILDTTGCSASAGIGSTMLMARLATRVAKPAGQFHISAEKVISVNCFLFLVYMSFFSDLYQWKEVVELWLFS